jgi:hypothetical protein
MEGLEDANKIRDPRQHIGTERPRRLLLPVIVRAVRNATEKRASILVTNAPPLNNMEEAF